jgi:hypothetical protein
MTYNFPKIDFGQISEGYTTINIIRHQAEIGNDDAEAILLAEKHGGELVTKAKPVTAPATGKPRTAIEVKPGDTGVLISEQEN